MYVSTRRCHLYPGSSYALAIDLAMRKYTPTTSACGTKRRRLLRGIPVATLQTLIHLKQTQLISVMLTESPAPSNHEPLGVYLQSDFSTVDRHPTWRVDARWSEICPSEGTKGLCGDAYMMPIWFRVLLVRAHSGASRFHTSFSRLGLMTLTGKNHLQKRFTGKWIMRNR